MSAFRRGQAELLSHRCRGVMRTPHCSAPRAPQLYLAPDSSGCHKGAAACPGGGRAGDGEESYFQSTCHSWLASGTAAVMPSRTIAMVRGRDCCASGGMFATAQEAWPLPAGGSPKHRAASWGQGSSASKGARCQGATPRGGCPAGDWLVGDIPALCSPLSVSSRKEGAQGVKDDQGKRGQADNKKSQGWAALSMKGLD